MEGESARRVVRRLAVPVYLPWAALSLGLGMLLPVLPLYLEHIDLSFTMLSVVLAASGVGASLGGLPVGALTQRMGENTVLVASLTTSAAVTAAIGATDLAIALMALRFVSGVALTGVRLSRQAFVARTVDIRYRGRAMSLLGGTSRLGFFVGPAVGGILIDSIGFTSTLVACGVVMASGILPIVVLGRESLDRSASGDWPTEPLLATLRPHWRRLLSAAIGPALIIAARRGRQIVLPLIAHDLGLSATVVGFIVAIGTGADLLLFPVSGYLMDRYGRLFAIVPAFGLMGVGLLILGLVNTTTGVVVAGAIIGIGNGMSAGALLTLGSDLAPPDIRAPFLAGFGSIHDLGGVVGPLIVGWSADRIGLSASAVVLAVVLFAAIAHLVFVVGETRNLTHPQESAETSPDVGHRDL
ncbi:MAG: MFS transporter [Actinomycetia bacterium]|nr:MFS transporter [Actinomycetes bacterium]